MFGSLLLLLCCELNSSELAPFTGQIAKLATPATHQAVDPDLAEVPADDDWPVEETPARMTDDGIPPTPAILNARGLAAASSVFATLFQRSPQTSAKRTGSVNHSRQVNVSGLSPVTPEVAEILDKWAAASQETRTSKIKVVRTVYNLVFEEERISEGELFYEAPDTFRMAFRPKAVGKREVSRRNNRSGRPFKLLADKSEDWIWSANRVVIINHDEKMYDQSEILDRDTREATFGFWSFRFMWAFPPLPLLHGFRTERDRAKYTFALHHLENGPIILIARPRTKELSDGLSECWIMINSTSWQATAIKIFDSTGNIETVLKVTEHEINPAFPKETFEPDLKALGYKSLSPLKVK